MATETLGAESARVIPFTYRKASGRIAWPADLPVFDPGNPAHVRAWRTMVEFGRLERQKLTLIAEASLERLDEIDGDPDLEEGAEQEAIDEREPDHDAEVETWAHWMDHAPENHIGHRPGHTD